MKVDKKRINKETNKVEICTEIVYGRDGIIVIWEDYDTMLLESTWGQCSHSDELYPLSVFRANSLRAQIEKEKIESRIKIRYAYIISPTNSKEDLTYYETLEFKVLTLAELELRPNRIDFEELITDGEGALIKILGRDRCTGRVDMLGNDIYENDRIRCYADSGGYMDEIVDQKALWISAFYTKDCKVVGTTYDKRGDI